MKLVRIAALFTAALWASSYSCLAQNTVRQLRADPDGGSILGVQSQARQLKTDPDTGEGFSYQVYPMATTATATPPPSGIGPIRLATPMLGALAPANPQDAAAVAKVTADVKAAAESMAARLETEARLEVNEQRAQALRAEAASLRIKAAAIPLLEFAAQGQVGASLYLPFDATRGLEKYRLEELQGLGPLSAAAIAAGTAELPKKKENLIQIKVRVVEVVRDDAFEASSVLDYISTRTGKASLFMNGATPIPRNVLANTDFLLPGLIAPRLAGEGLTYNITSKHINYIANLLQTEFHADLVTAPEVVTVEGQNVEFLSGSKFPFELGQNIVKEGTNNIQQFFYKHVGALISVTPARVFKEDGVTKDDVIQLKIVVRLSAANAKNMTTLNANGEPTDRPINFEDDVRAVANVIQVKSGYGVVMAGLLGEHEKKIVRKVPVIGDAPVVGFLFRSKGTERQKTETLIFVEAKVLHDDPCIAKAQSYEDFRLGEAYVRSSDVLDNPLEEGVYRAGFGTYLPPYSCDEARFWERLGRKVRRAATVLDDATE